MRIPLDLVMPEQEIILETQEVSAAPFCLAAAVVVAAAVLIYIAVKKKK